MRQAQASIEYLLIVGLLLIGVLFVFHRTSTEIIAQSRNDVAGDAVHTIAKTADIVNAMGPGSKMQVWVKIPKGVVAANASGNEALIRLEIFGAVSDIFESTDAYLEGDIPEGEGIYLMNIEKLDNKSVRVGR